ncbi:ABC transporter permease subunit [Curvibacter sp. CHRR-16]|uniref:ABC transporter permease n=1 Tax=Curvibacter sp. CHRR-16 TaxID=2835872 RepID=UPI001BDACDC6|nr:ABC transporter permease subunit [Curvibacter sp. CHRR-16]MBT0570448.1 ABC transporter permease subunit [Curvibacter sp. CHRR-16]
MRPRIPTHSVWEGLWRGGPFFLFAALFLLLPTVYLLVGSFTNEQGHFTLANIAALGERNVMDAYAISLRVSIASAVSSAILGTLLAWALVHGGLPTGLRSAVMTFCGVASNFAGVPLAFAFLSTLGRMGLVTVLLRTWFDFNLYSSGFNLLSFVGLVLTYSYFQISLMVLIISPALEGLRTEWREACTSLGGTALDFWRRIALPVLWPSILGATLLLFANAFGAIATAYALTGSSLNIMPILLYAQIRGDVLHNPHLGYAMALGMVFITGAANAGYMLLRMHADRRTR